LFASRFYNKKREHFNLPAEKKKEKEKQQKRRTVSHSHLDPRLTRYSNAPLKPSRFQSIIFRALTFQAVIGYLSIGVFSFCRIVFFVKKESWTIFIYIEIKFNNLQIFIDDFLWFSMVL